MAKDTDQLAGSFETENTGGLLSGFLADEDTFDRRSLWRIGSWGVGTVGAVVLAVLASQSQISLRREQFAAADLARQAQQIQLVAKESQNETRRLASAVDTLNGDRDRLYSRVTVLEQGLDSVTGAISRQSAAAASPQAAAKPPAAATEPQATAQNPAPAAAGPAPVVAPVMTTVAKSAEKPPMDTTAPEQAPATVASVPQEPKAPEMPAPTPATPLVAAKSIMAPPDAAATKLIEPDKPAKAVTAAPMPDAVASAPLADDPEPDAAQPAPSPAAPADVAVQRTEFGVDVGGANSVGGLRALWRELLKSRSNAALTALRPIIVIREGKGGFGMQLRLVAGPLSDAAAAAKICAGLVESARTCETAVFDGQRLAMKADEPAPGDAKSAMDKPAAAKPIAHKRSTSKRAANDDAAKKPDPPSTLTSFFGRR
jgi:hypothetical protein